MKCYDFEYDGRKLSEFGFILCDFDSKSVETIQNGSEISFNTVPFQYGSKHELTSVSYDDCLSATFQICKHPCLYDETEISVESIRDIMRWLNRKSFKKFKLIDEEYFDIYFEASFNVSKIEIGGAVRGFELDMTTNSPFAHKEPVTMYIENTVDNGEKTIVSESDEEGYIYPEMEITIDKDGDFEIYNELEDRTMVINGCKKGEVITIDYPIIRSSLNSHKIMNDFNFMFFRISRTYEDVNNRITMSLPCRMKIKYSPIVKVGI